MSRTRQIPASPAVEAFYQDAMTSLQAACRRHPHVRNLEVMAALARAAGYCIAMCHPDERDLARVTVIENVDAGTAAVAVDGPPRPGVHQA